MERRLEEYGVLFYEEPVAPENVEALARVSEAINIPLAAANGLPTSTVLANSSNAKSSTSFSPMRVALVV